MKRKGTKGANYEISRDPIYGGGVYNSGIFNMKSGIIDNNMDTDNETYGGGVYNDASGTFTMDSGTIKEYCRHGRRSRRVQCRNVLHEGRNNRRVLHDAGKWRRCI